MKLEEAEDEETEGEICFLSSCLIFLIVLCCAVCALLTRLNVQQQ